MLSDVDNTVVGWHSEDVPEEIILWVESLLGAGIGFCLVSNTQKPDSDWSVSRPASA